MTVHDVDAILDGGSTQTGDILALWALDSTQSGGSGQTGDLLAIWALDSSPMGGADQASDLFVERFVTSTLFGFTDMSSDIGIAMPLDSSLSGSAADLGADLFLLIGVNAGLSGDSDYNGTLLSFLAATLAASGSGFQVGLLADLLNITFQGGGTLMQADITWTPHPGAPPPAPSINAGALLQQFIDSTGSNRKRNKTNPANNPMVDSNPTPKPFKPK